MESPKLTDAEYLSGASFVTPDTIHLQFADRCFCLAIPLLEMPVDRFLWSKLAVLASGEGMTVESVKGEVILIDSASLRSLVDKEYAAKVTASIESLQFTRDELRELARKSPPPPEWFAQPERDLTRESWK